MRNLSLLSTVEDTLAKHLPPLAIVSAVAFDLDEDALYVAAERQTDDADVIVEVWKYRKDITPICFVWKQWTGAFALC